MTRRSSSPSIAVIGLACRYPDAVPPRELWDNILARRRQFRRIPDCRLPLRDYYNADEKTPDKTYGRQAAFIDGFDFDWAGRRIPLSTVRTTDIVHWLALETALAVVADAGYTRENLPGEQTGVIIGNTLAGEQTRANTMRLRWPFVRRALHSAARAQGLDDAQVKLLSRALKDRFTAAFPPVDEDTLAELLLQTTRLTGFSGETLDPDLPVEQGLRINSEKLQILVQETAAAMGIQAHVDIEPMLQRSLRQISEILERMIVRKQGAVAGAIVAVVRPTWVRNYVMDLVETPFPRLPDTWGMRSENDFQQARVLILHSDNTIDVAEMLGQQFFQRGALAQVIPFDAETVESMVQDPVFSHLVAILPRNGHTETDRSLLLQRMIHMRASITKVPPAASAPRRRTTVAWIQFGGGFFGRQPRFARLDYCAGIALGASLHLERDDLRVRVVDFCPTLSPEIIAWETLAEMITSERFAAVGYDLGRTRRTFFPRLVHPATFMERNIQWSAADVVLVTGGAKGITAACALAVARKTGVRMALVGRSAHSDQDAADEAAREIRSILEKYAAMGMVADYFSCDMADRGAVARMLASVADRLGAGDRHHSWCRSQSSTSYRPGQPPAGVYRNRAQGTGPAAPSGCPGNTATQADRGYGIHYRHHRYAWQRLVRLFQRSHGHCPARVCRRASYDPNGKCRVQCLARRRHGGTHGQRGDPAGKRHRRHSHG